MTTQKIIKKKNKVKSPLASSHSIGFTGTRNGLTEAQSRSLRELLGHFIQNGAKTFHHGDCIGADAEAHHIALELGYWIIIHPPIKNSLRAYCKGHEFRKERTHFARNRCIVGESHILIATPATSFETSGGTWYTINYAKKMGVLIKLIPPDGKVGL